MTAIRELEGLVSAVALEGSDHANRSLLHGPRHWRDVARVGLALCDGTPEADRLSVVLFALLHDSQRIDDGVDPDHGPRAAQFASDLARRGLIPLNARRLRVLRAAIARHTEQVRTRAPTAAVCLDADRLTLWRVGATPDARYLSTASAKDARAAAWAFRIVHLEDRSWARIFSACLDGRAPDRHPRWG